MSDNIIDYLQALDRIANGKHAPTEQRVPIDLVVQLAAPTVEHSKAAESPAGWRFVPHRDDNNLIVEIIATPIV